MLVLSGFVFSQAFLLSFCCYSSPSVAVSCYLSLSLSLSSDEQVIYTSYLFASEYLPHSHFHILFADYHYQCGFDVMRENVAAVIFELLKFRIVSAVFQP